ncbi:3-isopropylmalate dehydrogenase [Acetivibrio mesophilus]|uniref:3-isopropylmalate dehydrogenase n=1 Tax=Acetivibrio mesophilus TaxID=2487273 RepID=A0A4Q0I3K3_9FIRM|nr:3-isopropylmalate dehydrogenase [Acetivibrio mesophilus]ODM27357.1 3-isopropylmalate dehydrogenase [Clostridium sp. Bc-iso-3]RXE58808.1 3-isopropylmalate dehydrogenase [Acetivibrio mesophilus]HHV28960.1 3-isopropylmalate dehydrogenase [Clostridium sp.]
MGKYNIAVLPGDGIGPEVIEQAIKVIEAVGEKYNHSFELKEGLLGGCAIDSTGEPFPKETLELCKSSDAVLLGAVGGPKWDNLPGDKRPEAGLLGIRGALGLYANLRPAVIYQALKGASPLRSDIVKDGIDIMVVRELTGGMYFGERGRVQTENMGQAAFDTEKYSEFEIERIARLAFETAMKRNKKLMSVDKANVLESSRLWREVVIRVSKDYPEVELNHMYVDNAAMQLVRNPAQFDVIVTSNMFGDILSDEASMITGSIGMLPSASLGEGSLGLYEPIHGSAPDIAGQDKANPIATILSVAMMMKYSFGLGEVSDAIENAVISVLDMGYRTADIASADTANVVGTKEMGRLIISKLK